MLRFSVMKAAEVELEGHEVGGADSRSGLRTLACDTADSPWWCPGGADFSIETPAAETESQAPPPTAQLTCTHHQPPLMSLPVPSQSLWLPAASPQLVGSQLGEGGAPQAHTDSYWSWGRRAALWLAAAGDQLTMTQTHRSVMSSLQTSKNIKNHRPPDWLL